jgi:hypothetical protein
MVGNLSMVGSTQMNGSLVVTNNISTNTLNTGKLSVATVFNKVEINEWGLMTAKNFSLENGAIECQKITAVNGECIFGTTQRVTFNLGTMTATGSVNVSGDLNLTGKLSNASNMVVAGSINASGGIYTNLLDTPTITVDNLNIRSSNANNNNSYGFNDRGDINASSVNCDNNSFFNGEVAADNFKTIPLDVNMSSSFSVTKGGKLICDTVTANSNEPHTFGPDNEKVTLKEGKIETNSSGENKFGPSGSRVTLTGGNIVATGTITATNVISSISQETHTFGSNEIDKGYVKLTAGSIRALATFHSFGTNNGAVVFDNGIITSTGTGAHLFGASATTIGTTTTYSQATNHVKIQNGTITATGTISGGTRSLIGGVTLGANDILGKISTEGAISASGTISTTSTITATRSISGGTGSLIGGVKLGDNSISGNISTSGTIFTTGTISTTSTITATRSISGGTGSLIGGVNLGDNSISGNISTSGTIFTTGQITCGGISFGDNYTGNFSTSGKIIGGIGSLIGGVTLGDSSIAGYIRTTGTITATSFNATSDKRVKTKIEDLDPEHSRRLLRALRPKRYDFTNHQAKGCIGFIAQDIQHLGLPVHKSKGIIGNIQQDVICKEGWFRTEFPLHLGDLVKLGESTHEIVDYKEGMFRVQEPFTGIYSLYGIEVDDFLSIEPNAIFTVAVSALQAMDKQLNTQQEQIRFLIQVVGTVIFFSLGASIYVLLK